ncbi:MAG: ribonuclease HII [SAR324 cluster bacterium]|nr:ribonuclease HII [SAR324 cluster bacterium]
MPKKSRTVPSLKLEQQAWREGYVHVAGVDEAGRGPLAGPVVVAAVILGKNWNSQHPLNDSKKLSTKLRESLFDLIRKEVQAYRIVAVSPMLIDQVNILQATLLGMKRAINELKTKPDFVLVDGKQYPSTPIPGKPVIRGDTISCSIAAASILAKVARDRVMKGYHQIYPHWGFEKHKGYPTQQHRDAIEQYGTCLIHRHSFQCRSQKMKTEQLKLL